LAGPEFPSVELHRRLSAAILLGFGLRGYLCASSIGAIPVWLVLTHTVPGHSFSDIHANKQSQNKPAAAGPKASSIAGSSSRDRRFWHGI
jgi:hypothetical protein